MARSQGKTLDPSQRHAGMTCKWDSSASGTIILIEWRCAISRSREVEPVTEGSGSATFSPGCVVTSPGMSKNNRSNIYDLRNIQINPGKLSYSEPFNY